MKKILLASAVLALLGVSVTMNVLAQPPIGEGRPDGPPHGERGPGQNGPPRPPHPVMDALDKDGDHVISEEEINNAAASLKTLDKNGDGKLTDDEIRPPRPDGPPGREGEGRGPDGPPRGERPPGEDRPPRGERPPGEDGPPRGERPPGDDGPPRGERPPGDDGPPRGERPPGEDGPPRGERMREGQGRPPGRGEGPDGRPMGPPSPERFVEDALRFDADGDGKLDKSELMKFAAEMGNRQGRPPGREGGRGPGRPEGERPPGGREGQRPPGEREGERPQRPPVEE